MYVTIETLNFFSDPDSTLGALESTSRIALENPDNIDDETQTAIQDSSSEVAKVKTGQGPISVA